MRLIKSIINYYTLQLKIHNITQNNFSFIVFNHLKHLICYFMYHMFIQNIRLYLSMFLILINCYKINSFYKILLKVYFQL